MLLSPLLLSSCTALSALAAKSYRTQPDPPSWIDRLPQRNYTLILSDGTTTASCNLQPGAVLINGTSPGPTLLPYRGGFGGRAPNLDTDIDYADDVCT